MVIYAKHLLLVRRKLSRRPLCTASRQCPWFARGLTSTYLECEKNGVGLGLESDGSRALLNGLECILDLVQTALRREDSVVRIVRVSELQIAERERVCLGKRRVD